jgi:hypothetical protein
MLYKKAAIGETIHWVVATLVIIVILVASIFISSLLSEKKFLSEDVSLEGNDLLAVKSLTGYLLTQDSSGKIVFQPLQNQTGAYDVETFNEFNCDLAKNIFFKLYKENYRKDKIWLGIYKPSAGDRRNSCFEASPVQIKGGDENWENVNAPYALEQIKLDEERLLTIVMTN